MSSISYTLGDNVEKLTLAGQRRPSTPPATRSTTRSSATRAPTCWTAGGGNDTMTGGKGDDTYVVDTAGDVVNETSAEQRGRRRGQRGSAVTFTLATRTNVEHLTLTGSGNINGTGNALEQRDHRQLRQQRPEWRNRQRHPARRRWRRQNDRRRRQRHIRFRTPADGGDGDFITDFQRSGSTRSTSLDRSSSDIPADPFGRLFGFTKVGGSMEV